MNYTTYIVTLVILVLAPSSAFSDTGRPDDTLADIVQREIVLLTQEREALAKELDAIKAQGQAQEAGLTAKVEARMGALARTRAEADRVEAEIGDMDKAGDVEANRADLLATTLDQAVTTLAKTGFSMPETGDDTASLAAIFKAGADRILDGSEWRIQDNATFLDSAGRESRGKLLNLGHVAAFADTANGGGLLARSATGALQVITPMDHDAIAEMMTEDEFSGMANVFLMDPEGSDEAFKPAPTIMQTLDRGGIIVWPIVGLGLLALLVFMERLVTLVFMARWGTAGWLDQLTKRIATGDVAGALQMAKRRGGSVAAVARAALDGNCTTIETYEHVINEAILSQLPRLERGISMLNVVAATAPLLGLLGTVTGMIATFDIITTHGTGDPKLLSGGISEALITTEVGLIVAVPVLLMATYLTARSERISMDMERAAMAIGRVLLNSTQSVAVVDANLAETTSEHLAVVAVAAVAARS